MRLVFFDLDGVLVDTDSSWRYLHEHFGVNNDESLTKYLNGEIDDAEFMRRDIALWCRDCEVNISEISKVLTTVPIMKGCVEAVRELRRRGMRTAIVSGGIDLLAERVRHEAGIDYSIANRLATDDHGNLTGEGVLNVELLDKSPHLKTLMRQCDARPEDCVAIGDSQFDVSMFKSCGLGIAFNPSDELARQHADVIIERKDLLEILPPINRYFRED